MLNQEELVPDKTIAVFPFNDELTKERLSNIIEPLTDYKKRDWFDPHFYNCLPLVIGNVQGFVIKAEYDFEFAWDGRIENYALTFGFYEKMSKIDKLFPRVESHFGHGIITIGVPFALRTPPDVNLMTINPPNFVLPNVTVMTGVVETDNLRRDFTFNLKVQMPNIRVRINKGTPLAGFIPIPRYYADKFELKMAEELFSKELIEKELKATEDLNIHRFKKERPGKLGGFYKRGVDVYGTKFKNHQK